MTVWCLSPTPFLVASGSYRRTRSESDLKRPAPSSSVALATKKAKRRSSSSGTPPLEERPNARDPPEPEDLLKKMFAVEGECSALQDTATRQAIASFPPEVHDPTLLQRVKGEARALTRTCCVF